MYKSNATSCNKSVQILNAIYYHIGLYHSGIASGSEPKFFSVTIQKKKKERKKPPKFAKMAASAATSASLSQSEEDLLKVAVFQRLHPRAYLERFLAENIRPDKRLCDGFRDVHVNVGEF